MCPYILFGMVVPLRGWAAGCYCTWLVRFISDLATVVAQTMILRARRVTQTIVTRLLSITKVLLTRCVFCWRLLVCIIIGLFVVVACS